MVALTEQGRKPAKSDFEASRRERRESYKSSVLFTAYEHSHSFCLQHFDVSGTRKSIFYPNNLETGCSRAENGEKGFGLLDVSKHSTLRCSPSYAMADGSPPRQRRPKQSVDRSKAAKLYIDNYYQNLLSKRQEREDR